MSVCTHIIVDRISESAGTDRHFSEGLNLSSDFSRNPADGSSFMTCVPPHRHLAGEPGDTGCPVS